MAIATAAAMAQTAVWQLPPTDYTALQPYAAGLYTATVGTHKGIIRADGTTLVPIVYDDIAPYHDGKALLTTRQGANNAVGGYLSADGRYVAFSTTFYTIPGIDFYSCGMLPATDAQGRKGYLDERGAPVLGFDGSFTQVTPFSEGYAAVFHGQGDNKKYALIDRHGNRAMFRLGLGEVYSGTNVCGGKAIIWDTNGKFYAYDTSTGRCTPTTKPHDTSLDYLFCFAGISHRTRDIPYTHPTPPQPDGAQPVLGANGLYGYAATDGHMVLPPQFAAATPFAGGIAAVSLGGRCGLLRWMPAATAFAATPDRREYSYEAGESVTCRLGIAMPEPLAAQGVQLTATDATTGQDIAGQFDGATYAITLQPQTPAKDITLTATTQGLTLWQGQVHLAFHRINVVLQVSIAIARNIANKAGQVPVTVTIANSGTDDGTTQVHITGSSTLIEKHETVTVPAGGSVQLQTAFAVRSDVSGQYVNVTTSRGASASRKGLNFESYY